MKYSLVTYLLIILNATIYSQLPTVVATQCGKTYTSITGKQGTVYCTKYPNAVKYKFKIEGTDYNFLYEIEKNPLLNSLGAVFTLKEIPGLKNHTTYNVSIAVLTSGSNVWSPFGEPCEITTPAWPLAYVYSGCNTTINNYNHQLIAYVPIVLTISNYTIRLQNMDGDDFYNYEVSHNSGTNYNTLLSRRFYLHEFPGLKCNTTYNVSVKYNNGGDWKDWGPVCQITTPSCLILPDTFEDRLLLGSAGQFFENSGDGSGSISFSLGEPFTKTYESSSSNGIINQGFQQEDFYGLLYEQDLFSAMSLGPELDFEVYPNPFYESITIVSPKEYEANGEIQIQSMTGQVIEKFNHNIQRLTYETSHLPNGKYIVVIVDANQQVLADILLVK